LEYNTALFDASTITQMLAQYRTLLTEVAANPKRHVLDIRLDDERPETDPPDHASLVHAEYAADEFDF
jgi:non-ribosomal peptide synthetase component F